MTAWQRPYSANTKNDGASIALVLPYLNHNIDASGYDSTVYPPLESVPPRFVISKRNQWAVDEANVVVAYVTHGWGSAVKTLEYAVRKKKRIISYTDANQT